MMKEEGEWEQVTSPALQHTPAFGSWIGRQTAIALSEAGWKVVLTARRLDMLKETAALCKNETLILAGNVLDEEFVVDLFRIAVSHFGRLDLLFNNAGISAKPIPIETMSLQTFKNVIDVNLVGSFLATREAFKIFKSQEPQGGKIINNGSLSAHVPRPNSFPYTCSKHAITGLTRSTALDGRPFSITCTQIDIGNALTDMSRGSTVGALQPDGCILEEPTFDAKHVGSTIVHIASLPPDVAMLQVNIMYGIPQL
ncbi:unnamed protein product [Cyclocybe aegerita]|uniref:Short-chain dehydrogenase/reductase SDR n=1 Tax=Cyclocybe aegerita TaxID=1973307 RepID=A0A8S0XNV3_CYCAE|nr:unnamed protein product [Cyclocybe aegerita]